MHKHYDIVIPFIGWLAIATHKDLPFCRPLIERGSGETVVCCGAVKLYLNSWKLYRRYV